MGPSGPTVSECSSLETGMPESLVVVGRGWSVMRRAPFRFRFAGGAGLAVRAKAPEGHVGLVDDEPGGGRGCRVEAGRGANHAVDVRDRSARAADHVVMVVAHAGL